MRTKRGKTHLLGSKDHIYTVCQRKAAGRRVCWNITIWDETQDEEKCQQCERALDPEAYDRKHKRGVFA